MRLSSPFHPFPSWNWKTFSAKMWGLQHRHEGGLHHGHVLLTISKGIIYTFHDDMGWNFTKGSQIWCHTWMRETFEIFWMNYSLKCHWSWLLVNRCVGVHLFLTLLQRLWHTLCASFSPLFWTATGISFFNLKDFIKNSGHFNPHRLGHDHPRWNSSDIPLVPWSHLPGFTWSTWCG